MASLTIGGKTVFTQTGTDEPVLSSDVTGTLGSGIVIGSGVDLGNADLSSTTFPAGHVLQTLSYVSTASDNLALNTSSNVNFDQFNVTVKENSRILLFFHAPQYTHSITSTNLQYYLFVDGVRLTVNSEYATNANHIFFGNSSFRMAQFNYFITEPLTAGTHTLDFVLNRYDSGTVTVNYQGIKFRYLIQEISG